jgi:hypothetical protein
MTTHHNDFGIALAALGRLYVAAKDAGDNETASRAELAVTMLLGRLPSCKADASLDGSVDVAVGETVAASAARPLEKRTLCGVGAS